VGCNSNDCAAAVVVGKNESTAGHSARSIGGIVGATVGATVVGGCIVGPTAIGRDQHKTQPLLVLDPSLRHVKVSSSATDTFCGPALPW